MNFDPIAILRTLALENVRFVIIGGIAAGALGSPSATGDLDVCYDRAGDNLRRLAGALRSLKATLRGAPPDLPFLLDEQTLKAADHFTLTTELGDLDLLGTPAGSSGYRGLISDAIEAEMGGFVFKVASLDALIKMKQAAGRPKDRVELEILYALRDELEGTHPQED